MNKKGLLGRYLYAKDSFNGYFDFIKKHIKNYKMK